jgi:single-strand DNA-binding protein
MASFARIAVFGNIGQDPETRYTPSGTMIVSFSIAVNPRPRGGQNRNDELPATWYRVSAFGELADRLDKLSQQGYIAKGRSLYIEGRFEPREFTGNDGQKRISYDINATNFEFVGGDRRDGDQGNYGGGQQSGNFGGSNTGFDGGSRRNSYDNPASTDIDDVPF